MATSTLTTILDRLSQRIGDFNEEQVTTAINANTSVVCTTWGSYVNQDDVFNRYWIYFNDYANAGAYRKVADYVNSTNTITVRGANLSDDSANKATVQLHKYDRRNKIRAINIAARDTNADLFRIIRNSELITNNILPNSSFEDWSSSSSPDNWALTNATSAEETGAGNYRGVKGSSSAVVTASSSNGYLYITSDTVPWLLDMQGHSITVRVWAKPQTSNDAAIVIYTKQADGTAQTLTSTTANPAGEYSLLELEHQELNDNLVEIQIRLKVATNGQLVYFDNCRAIGPNINEMILPLDFQNPLASVSNIYIQQYSQSEWMADDLMAHGNFDPLWGYDTKDNATSKHLVLPPVPSERLLTIEGTAPLESNLSATSDTMTIEDPELELFIQYAAYVLFDLVSGLPSGQDRQFLREEATKYLGNYYRQRDSLGMTRPRVKQRFDPRLFYGRRYA